MARKGKAPTVQNVAEAAAAQAVKEVIPSILKAVAAEVAKAVEPAVIAAVQASIREAVQRAVNGATGGLASGPVVSFGAQPAPVAPRTEYGKVTAEIEVEPTEGEAPAAGALPDDASAPVQRPKDPNSPEGRAWLAAQMARSNAFGEKSIRKTSGPEKVPVRTGNPIVDRMLVGAIQPVKNSDLV